MTKNTKPPLPTYSLVEDPIDDVWVINITDGIATGVAYSYRQIKFVPGLHELHVQFNYNIILNPNGLTTPVLVPIFADILDDLLKKDKELGSD